MNVVAVTYVLVALACLTPWVSSAVALLAGVALALFIGNPYLEKTRKWSKDLLPISVIGLGAGMNLVVVGRVGLQGVGYTAIGLGLAFLIGTFLGKILKTEKDTSLLITVGTAICGGSAIAAVAPVIQAKAHEVSVSLGIVFLLNGLALFLFPPIGHLVGLSQAQFGLWSALAIHDTSSVVGATMQYGAEALQVGTTVKLARALWIVPVAVAIGHLRSRSRHAEAEAGGAGKSAGAIKKPWFILVFLIAAALVTWIPELKEPGRVVEMIARRLLVLTLFLIGSGITKDTLKAVGFRPLVQGVFLWLLVSTLTLGAIHFGWISR